MTRDAPWDDGRDLKQKILRSHRELGILLQRLESGPTQREVAEIFSELRWVMRGHFELEEGADGLFEVLHAKAPHSAPLLETFCCDHRELLAELEHLERDARSGEDLAVRSAEFVDHLRRHEKAENELLVETLSTDLGGMG